ncbi:MAG TPA: CpaF family protein [Acidimicrobiia bacterium]|nr:CpaF family protein [Acidimicrobiia bacterium]
MRLSDRLKAVREEQGDREGEPLQRVGAPAPVVDGFADYKTRVRETLFSRMGARAFDASLTEAQLHRIIVEELGRLIAEEGSPLSEPERDRIAADISKDILGYGPLEEFLHDTSVTEIMVNSTEFIYVEREGHLHRTRARFPSEESLRRVIDRIAAKVGRRVDESSPMVDARLPDGSRVNAVIPPLAVDGPALTIRKFSRDPFQVEDLIRFSTLTAEIATLLSSCVEGRLNVLITGGTGTGKTTLLNVLSSFIPEDHRIVTIEDSVELQLRQEHVVRLEYRPPNIEGRGEVTIRDLVRNSLRMRPDRIIVGEVRGGEALDMLQAMNTGHEGSMSTLHANSPRDALNRLETMVMMAGIELPVKAIREYISSALRLIVHLARFKDGTRRISHITEVTGMEGDLISLQDVFRFEYLGGTDGDGKVNGAIRPTGIRPMFADRLVELGVALPRTAFDRIPQGFAGR